MPLGARGMALAFALLWVGPPARAAAQDDASKPEPGAEGSRASVASDTGQAVIVAAKELLPCSRHRPAGVTGFWQPEPELVVKIDAELPRILRHDQATRRLLLPFPQYHRQYIGFLRGQQRMVYINAFPVADAAHLPGWQKNLIVACHGGSRFWGIEYSVAKARFSHFAANREDAAAKDAVVENKSPKAH